MNRGTIHRTNLFLPTIHGDDGADLFENFGSLTDLIFEGGADADEFVNHAMGVLEQISFEGDDGADRFSNFGSVIGAQGIVFQGGADADLFSNMGQISTSSQFFGGVGADRFVNRLQGTIGSVTYQGDAGNDEFLNEGVVQATATFVGGGDADTLYNSPNGVMETIDYQGDDGADSLVIWGELSSVIFTGGADTDLFFNAANQLSSITFTGGSDADIFQNFGDELGSISFEGDDGADVFISAGDEIASISFEGDDGADVFVTLGSDIGSIQFEGDASDTGSDTFVNRADAAGPSSKLIYSGFGGNDSLRNDGDGWDIFFVGGADNDVFQNNAPSLSNIRFQGDDGADVFENNGEGIVGIRFEGDAGADVFANDGYGVVDISFEGDDGADVFINTGDWVSGILFEGDDGFDSLSNMGDHVSNIRFNGGLDTEDNRFINMGASSSDFTFHGGLGDDLFLNREIGILASLFQFNGHAGEDRLINYASEMTKLSFSGGADADLFQNFGTDVTEVSFEGDDGEDQATNAGLGLIDFVFNGSNGDDVFQNFGNGFDRLLFQGGSGANSLLQRGDAGGTITMQGGPDTDAFVNFGSDIDQIQVQGDAGEDRLQNNGSRVGTIVFLGGAGNGALQNNGDEVGNLSYTGGIDADTLLNNGSKILSLQFWGDGGADSLINTGDEIEALQFDGGEEADLLRSQGIGLGDITFTGATGDDAMLFSGTTELSTTLRFDGGSGNDVLAFRGKADVLVFQGGIGDDSVVISGGMVSALLNVPTQENTQADVGDDRFSFDGTPTGSVTIGEAYGGVLDTSQDTLDFSAFHSGNVQVDIANLAVQQQPGGLSIQLTSALGIENVVGSPGEDIVRGNERDNYISGAQYNEVASSSSVPVGQERAVQWVLLDFDSDTEEIAGEHFYEEHERREILERIESTYHVASDWFRLRFTMDAGQIPSGVDFVTIRFNQTPTYGRPGGESSEIDFGNRNYGGEARVQVNGLMGGIELPASPNADFMEELPEDSESRIGRDMPIGTSQNLVALSAKIAAHELGHLLGLRHYDAFGPVGFGIHSPPGASQFKPEFQGMSAAFETFEHIIGSPASIGSTRQNDIGELFFGEREAVKIAFAASGPAEGALSQGSLATWSEEMAGTHNDVEQAQEIPWRAIRVPNTLAKGLNVSKNFYVDTLAVSGTIQLAGQVSESDFYSFQGSAGDVVSIELLSKSLKRFSSLGTDGYIDSMIRLFRRIDSQTVVPVTYYNSVAENDDEFETSDSVLFDVTLPADAEYIVEVDTFSRGPRPGDPTPEEVLTLPSEIRENLEDALQDSDVGQYELFAYRFAKASALDGIDILEGRGGLDQIEGGPGDQGSVELGLEASSFSINEGDTLVTLVSLIDLRGESWTVAMGFGDGSPSTASTVYSPSSGIPFSHRYLEEGNFRASITATNNYGLSTTVEFDVLVSNVAPTIHSVTLLPSAIGESQSISLSSTFSDPGSIDGHSVTIEWGDETSTILSLNAGVFQFEGILHSYLDDNATDTYAIRVVVTDGVAPSLPVTQTVEVFNLAPDVATITGAPTSSIEGTPILLSSVVHDPSPLDKIAYDWSLKRNGILLQKSSNSTLAFTPADDGTYLVELVVSDDDGGTREAVSVTLNVANAAPSGTLSHPASIDEGSSLAVQWTSLFDPSPIDAQDLRFSFALAPEELAIDYSKASLSSTYSFGFNDSGNFSIFARVFDKDGGWYQSTSMVSVQNIAPSATLAGPSTATLGSSAIFTMNNPSDPSPVDQQSLRYSFARNVVDLAQNYSAASVFPQETFVFTTSGSSTVYARVFDKDGGMRDESMVVVVEGEPPTDGVKVLEVADRGKLVRGGAGTADRVQIVLSLSEATSAAVERELDSYQSHLDSGGANLPFALPLLGITVVGFEGFDKLLDLGGVRTTYLHPYVGTNYSETITGSPYADLIVGNGGNDTLLGLDGHDIIIGSSGDDSIQGGDGDDRYFYLNSSSGFDTLVASTGFDRAIAPFAGTVIGLNAYNNGVEEFLGSGDTILRDTNYSSTLNFGATLLTGIAEIDAAGGNDTLTASNLSDGVYRGGSGDDAFVAGSKAVTWLYAGNANGYDSFTNGSGVTQAIAQSAGTVIGLNGYANGVDTFQGFGDTILRDTSYSSTLNFSATLLTGIVEIDAAGGNDALTASNLSDGVYRGGSGDDALVASSKAVTWLYAGNANGYDSFTNGSGVTQAIAQSAGTVIGLNGYANGVDTFQGFGDTILRDTNYSSTLNFGATLLTGIVEIDAAGGNDTLTASNLSDAVYRGGSGDDALVASSKAVTWLYAGSANGYDSFTNGSGVTQAIAQSAGTVIGLNGYANGVDTFQGFGDTILRDTNYSSTLNFGATLLTGIAEIDAAGGNDTLTASNLSDGVYRGGSGDDALVASSKAVTWLYSGDGNGYDSFTNGAGVTQAIAQSAGTVIGLNGYANGVDTFLGFGDTILRDTNYSSTLNFSATLLTGIAEIDAAGGNDTLTASNLSDGVYRGGSGDDALSASSKAVTWLYVGNSNGNDSFSNGSGLTQAVAQSAGTVIGLNGYANGVDTFLGTGDTILRDTNYSSTLNFGATLLTGIAEIDAAGGNDTLTASNLSDGVYRGGSGDDALVASSKAVTWLYAGDGNGYDSFTNGSGVTQAIAQSAGTVIGLNGYANGVDTFQGFGDTILRDTNYSSTLNFGATLLTGIAEIDAAGGNDTLTASNLSDGVYRGGSGDDVLLASSKAVTWLYAGIANGYDSFSNGSGVTQAIAQTAGTVIGLNGYANGVDAFQGFGDTILRDTNYSSTLNFSATLLTGIAEIDAAGGNDTIVVSAGSAAKYRLGTGNDLLVFSSIMVDLQVSIIDFCASGIDRIDVRSMAIAGGFASLVKEVESPNVRVRSPGMNLLLLDFAFAQLSDDDFWFL